MVTAAMNGRPATRNADRNAFLALVTLVWVGIVTGFGTDSFEHVRRHGVDYPFIVHVHAVVFTTWLVLFTVQVALIRKRRPDLHQRLGIAGALLAAGMVILGPATALRIAAMNFDGQGDSPEFLAVEFITILAFAVFTGSGLLLRRTPAAHKRLMLLGLIYLSTPGFARYVNGLIANSIGLLPALGNGVWGLFVRIYLGPDILMVGLGIYDLVTRRRLFLVYLAGIAFTALLQYTALILLQSPAWKILSLRLISP